MLLMDTDVVVDIMRQRPPALAWLAQNVNAKLAVPGFVVLELTHGCRNLQELMRARRTLDQWSVLWPDESECDKALARFKAIHLQNAIGVLDILIAQTALAVGLPLHTFNVKHFSAVPGLQTIQPYIR